jgi:hypothetical protein
VIRVDYSIVINWIIERVFSGILTGIIGFFIVLMLYRFLYYNLINREKIKIQILDYIKLCNGYRENDFNWSIPIIGVTEDGDTPSFYPTTKAITQWVRKGHKLFEFTRWGFKYDEEYINTLLEDMHVEGRIGAIYNKVGEIEGWKYHSHTI